MKKIFLMVSGLFIAISLFAFSGTPVKAANVTNSVNSTVTSNDCGCNVSPVVGGERLKYIFELLLSKDFWVEVFDMKKQGYNWNGINDIQVIRDNETGMVFVGVPFTNKRGVVKVAVFNDGNFLGLSDM